MAGHRRRVSVRGAHRLTGDARQLGTAAFVRIFGVSEADEPAVFEARVGSALLMETVRALS